MPPKAFEGGIRPIRLEMVREDTPGVPPSDPDFRLYSDTVNNYDPSGIDPGIEPQRGLGDADPKAYFTGTGSFPITVEYQMQQWYSATGDPAYDGLTRDQYNRLQATHTVVRRMEQGDLDVDNTVNGSNSKDTRQYIVGLGGRIDTVTVDGDPTSALPVTNTLDYLFEKFELVQIDQPDSASTLDVAGLATGTDVEIEQEDGTAETVTADGTTSTSFADIDAVYLTQQQTADVTISVSGGDDLCVIYGATNYDFDEGQRGVPPIGGGSHATAIGTDYEVVQGDTIERPVGTALADEINTTSFVVENNVSEDPSTTGPRPVLVANERMPSVDATVMGETEQYQFILDALQANGNDLVWTLDGGTLTLEGAQVDTAGAPEEPSQGMKSTDATLNGTGVAVS